MTLSFQGLPLERQRSMLLRPGDEVSARVVGEEVHVLEVLARASRPVVGITRAKGRYPYVESLSPDYKGRVSLINPDEAVDGETVAVEILGEERRALSGRIIEHLGWRRRGRPGRGHHDQRAWHSLPSGRRTWSTQLDRGCRRRWCRGNMRIGSV